LFGAYNIYNVANKLSVLLLLIKLNNSESLGCIGYFADIRKFITTNSTHKFSENISYRLHNTKAIYPRCLQCQKPHCKFINYPNNIVIHWKRWNLIFGLNIIVWVFQSVMKSRKMVQSETCFYENTQLNNLIKVPYNVYIQATDRARSL